MADDKNWWKRKDGLMFHSEADRLHYDSLPETTPQENRSMGLLMKILLEVRTDERNPDDYSDDADGILHNDCPTNPHSKNWHPEGEAFIPDAFIDDYELALIRDGEDNKAYGLLNEYLYMSFPYESDYIKTMTLVIFADFMQIDFSDVLDLVAMHPTKPSTTGFSKLSKELQGVNKKILTDVIMDYIQMMKEAGMPSINEDHIIAMKDKGMTTLAEFWHIYGTMANLLDGTSDSYYFRLSEMANANVNRSALKRFKEKISDDKNVLYPLLAYLYSQWANDKDWKQQTNRIQNAIPGSGGEHEFFNDLGYSGLMYAQDNLEHYRWKDNGYHLYKNRKEDWNEFKDSDFESLDNFIKNKYFT